MTDTRTDAPDGFPIDERWQAIAEETLRRPPIPMSAPGHCAHLVFRTSNEEADRHHEHVRKLFSKWGVTVELDTFDQLIGETYSFVVKWERHTEFCSLAVFSKATQNMTDLTVWPPFPADWRETNPGTLIVALKIAIEPKGRPIFPAAFIAMRGGSNRVVSAVNAGNASVEACFRPAADGYMHMLVRAGDAPPEHLGRLAQRLIEIETYRVLALYAWPDVKAMGPQLNQIEGEIAEVTEELCEVGAGEDRALLERLTTIARQIERITGRTHFRFNAAIAYDELVQRRLDDLRESPVEGEQRLSIFVNRRLSPAVRTYQSILKRQDEMSGRASRATELLRSRLDVELAQQNQSRLASMDRRTHLQYRLQQTVEGLSIFAISYYAIGIVSYLLTGLSSLVHGLDVHLWTGIAAPFVVALVAFGMWRVRARFHDN
jgi:uncharacterized membrane-anchored protein